MPSLGLIGPLAGWELRRLARRGAALRVWFLLLYTFALVFVGGSLIPHGGQNMLEPAALGRAVVYGPHLRNFLQEAALLERAGASQKIAGAAELGPVFAALLADAERAQEMGRAGMRAVEAQKGASARTLEALRRGCLEPLAMLS